MSITISVPEKPILKPKIVVFGVGGGGCNAVNNMITSGLKGVDFVAANTDAQSLSQSHAERCIQMGTKSTQGLGAGSHPEIGFESAEEVMGDISDAIHGAHMVFVTAGMGGGTGTGAAPVVARVAKEMGALTVGVVTKPFLFEGNRRMRIADAGIEEMEQYIDTLLVIPNQNLFRVSNEHTSFTDAFMMADKVLLGAVGGITNLMVNPGIINLDFADVRTVMGEMGKAMIGTGEASGEGRAIQAAELALNNPLLDDVSMRGARGVLISISASDSLKLYELDEAMQRIRSEVDEDARIIPGTAVDNSLGDMLKVSVVATGIGQHEELALPNEEGKVNLEVVQGQESPEDKKEEVDSNIADVAMEAQHEEKPVFQIVPPSADSIPESKQQEVVSQTLVAEGSPSAPVPQAPVSQTPVAHAPVSETLQTPAPPPPFPSREHQLREQQPNDINQGIDKNSAAHPFGTLSASTSSGAKPSQKEERSKGFFGWAKAKLVKMTGEDRNREYIPARAPTSPAPPSTSSLEETTSKPAAAPLPLPTPATPQDTEEESLDIPSFLKGQAN